MKFLILGAGGMVGHAVSLRLRERGHAVIEYDDRPNPKAPDAIPIRYGYEKLARCIADGAYDAVVNCTAVINQDAEADQASAAYINAFIPHCLEQLTANTGTVVVHRSTDCIFSGARGCYDLNDTPDAGSFYARTKAVGELRNGKDITIRTSLIGPETDGNGTGLFNWFLRQRGDVLGYANAIWTGITTIEFADAIEQLLLSHAHGLFQCVPDHSISKYELLLLFEKYFPNGRNIVRVDNKRVDKSLVQSLGNALLHIPDYEEMIANMAAWIAGHAKIYKNCYDVRSKENE